jgi:pimeloyl-ACP methyl ester carboxylesterase
MQAETPYGFDEEALPHAPRALLETLGGFLEALDRTIEEVRSRSPEYFEQHALRTTLPALEPGIGDRIGADPSSLSAVDRLFESRVGRDGFLKVVGLESPEEIEDGLGDWIQRQSESRRSERSRLAGFPGEDSLRSVRGGDLQYHVFGDAGPTVPTVVVVNAIGMGLEYWSRFVDRLAPDHRIVLWPLRTTNRDGEVADLDDQIRDIGAVIDEVSEEPVHLMGWCSGPKLCLRYAATHPQRVASMVLLAGTYGNPTTETGYQKRLGKVFELLDRSPGMAATVRGMLTDSASVAAGLSSQSAQAGGGELLQEPEILARADPRLQMALVAPYRSDETTLAYARQIRDFWSRPLDADARAAGCPTLVVSAEFDRIASPKLGQDVAKTLSRGRFVEMPGATHYCMYDRPDEVAALVRDFLASIER